MRARADGRRIGTSMTAQHECEKCGKLVSVLGSGKLRAHGPNDRRCEGSGTQVGPEPPHIRDIQRANSMVPPRGPGPVPDRVKCPECDVVHNVTAYGKIRIHLGPGGKQCDGSFKYADRGEIKAWRERNGRIEENRQSMNPVTGEGARYADVDVPPTVPPPAPCRHADDMARGDERGQRAGFRSVETVRLTTPVLKADPMPIPGMDPERGPFSYAQPGVLDEEPPNDLDESSPQVPVEDQVAVAYSYSQPGPAPKTERRTRQPLTGDAANLVGQIRHMFWSYQNQQQRTLQTSLGPSEAGTDCDRRIAYRLAGAAPVNHVNDSWAAFKGTAVHTALEGMFRWADMGRGRFLVDRPVDLGDPHVPRGKVDQYDRALLIVEDNKLVGKSTLSKMWLDGQPSVQYQKQLHLYGYGLRRDGERVDRVGLIAWPGEGSSLDDLWAWVVPYDEQQALDALNRVSGIAAMLGERPAWAVPARPGFYCGHCPFYRPLGATGSIGCNGKD